MTRATRISFTGWAVVIAVILVVWMVVTAAGCCPKPPKCPLPPPPVVVVKSPPPCVLPALPDPLPQIGVPDAPRDGYFVPRQSWALLGGYQAEIRSWIVAAAGCLTAGRHAP